MEFFNRYITLNSLFLLSEGVYFSVGGIRIYLIKIVGKMDLNTKINEI